MKEDKQDSFIYRCPVNGNQINIKTVQKSRQCPSCGHQLLFKWDHACSTRGKWFRPSLWERLQGERAIFKSNALMKNGG